MKKHFRGCFVFCLIFTFVSILTVNSNAANNESFSNIEEQLGILASGGYANTDISNIAVGRVIEAQVVDPSKMGGCKAGDKVELKNLGDGRWTITHLATIGVLMFSVNREDGRLKVKKTGTFNPNNKQDSLFTSGNLNLPGRSALGARISYVDYSDDDYTVFGVEVDTELDEAVMFGLNYTYFFTDYFSIELSGDYVKTDVDLSALGLTEKAGELKQIPILLSGRFSVPIKDRVVPYIGGGVGYFFNDFDQEDQVIEFIYGRGADVDVDNSFGFLISGGMDIFFNRNIALNLDAKYIWNKIEAEVDAPGFDDEKFDANMFVIGAGFKYYF